MLSRASTCEGSPGFTWPPTVWGVGSVGGRAGKLGKGVIAGIWRGLAACTAGPNALSTSCFTCCKIGEATCWATAWLVASPTCWVCSVVLRLCGICQEKTYPCKYHAKQYLQMEVARQRSIGDNYCRVTVELQSQSPVRIKSCRQQ